MATVAEVIVDTLVLCGIKRVYGLPGDSLNGVTESIRTHPEITWVHVRHEEAAAFAAGAEAHLTGEIAVCAGSCGPGNLHFINGLFDCHRSRVPVLAIASQIPSTELGTTYFQETYPEQIFKDCSHYCGVVFESSQMPRLLAIAMRTAIAKRGVAVIVLPGDIANKEATALLQPIPSFSFVFSLDSFRATSIRLPFDVRGPTRDQVLRDSLSHNPCEFKRFLSTR